MRKVTIECFLGIDDEINERDISNFIQPTLEKLANAISSESEEVECYGFSVRGSTEEEVLNNSNKKLICTLESKDVDNTFDDRFLIETYPYYAIRVPVEGDESHRDRFLLMDKIVNKSGVSLEEEKANVYFIFDTGKPEEFSLLASSILLNSTYSVKNYAIKRGISFCQWIKKSERDKILEELDL